MDASALETIGILLTAIETFVLIVIGLRVTKSVGKLVSLKGSSTAQSGVTGKLEK